MLLPTVCESSERSERSDAKRIENRIASLFKCATGFDSADSLGRDSILAETFHFLVKETVKAFSNLFAKKNPAEFLITCQIG
jgi:hypothetical protein